MVVKAPPMITWLPVGDRIIECTLPPWALGAQGSRAPSEALTAADAVRAMLPTELSKPPK